MLTLNPAMYSGNTSRKRIEAAITIITTSFLLNMNHFYKLHHPSKLHHTIHMSLYSTQTHIDIQYTILCRQAAIMRLFPEISSK